MFSNHSVPSPICTFAFSLLEITSISASCSSLPLSDTCTAYFPSCSFTTFPFTLIDAIVLSVEYFMMFTWYVVLSPLSDFTIMSTVVFSFAVDIVFDNTCVAVSPAISTVALSLVVTTSTDDSSLFLSIYFVYVFVLESYSSAFVLFIVIWHVVSVDFLSISSIYDLLVSPSCAVIVIFLILSFCLRLIVFLFVCFLFLLLLFLFFYFCMTFCCFDIYICVCCCCCGCCVIFIIHVYCLFVVNFYCF